MFFTCLAKFVANIIAVSLAKYVLRDFVQGIVQRSEILSLVAASAKEEPYKMLGTARKSMKIPLFQLFRRLFEAFRSSFGLSLHRGASVLFLRGWPSWCAAATRR